MRFLFLWRWVPPDFQQNWASFGTDGRRGSDRLGLATGLGLGISTLWKQWLAPMILGTLVTTIMVGIGMWACVARTCSTGYAKSIFDDAGVSRVLAGGCIVTSIWLSGKVCH